MAASCIQFQCFSPLVWGWSGRPVTGHQVAVFCSGPCILYFSSQTMSLYLLSVTTGGSPVILPCSQLGKQVPGPLVPPGRRGFRGGSPAFMAPQPSWLPSLPASFWLLQPTWLLQAFHIPVQAPPLHYTAIFTILAAPLISWSLKELSCEPRLGIIIDQGHFCSIGPVSAMTV